MNNKIILLVSVLFCFFTSCEIDNFEEPNAEVHGYFYDAKDGQTLVGSDIIDGNSIGVYEQGFSSESKQTWFIDNTGEYLNKRVFAATYRVEFINTNFYPYEGDEMWTVNKGKNERNFLVTPFIRIKDASITYDSATDQIIAKCKLEAGGNDITLNQVRLYAFTDKWVGNRVNSGIQGSAVINAGGETIDPTKEYTLVINRANHSEFFKYSRNYYFRIGARAQGPSKYGTIRHNYSPLVVISI